MHFRMALGGGGNVWVTAKWYGAWGGVPFPGAFWVRHIKARKMPPQKEGVSSTENIGAFLGL